MAGADELELATQGLPAQGPLRAVIEVAAAELSGGRADACVARLTESGLSLDGAGAHLLGLAYRRLGDLYRASAAFEQAVARDPRRHAAQVALARLYVEQQDHARAASVLRRALELVPEDPPTLALLAESYLAMGRPRRAEALARRGLEGAPGATGLRAALADALRAQDRHVEAVAVLEAGPLTPEMRVALGRSRLALGQPDEARQHFEAVLRRDGDSVGALAGVAEILADEGRLTEARGYVLRALAAAPQVAHLHLLSARIHLADGRATGALRAAEAALRLVPQDPDAARLALRASRASRRFGAAADLAEGLLARVPDDAEALAAVGLQQIIDGQAAAALPPLEAALARQPDAAELHFAAGCALLALGRTAEGAGQLAHVLRLAPEHPLAAAVLPVAYDEAAAADPQASAAAVRAALFTGQAPAPLAPRPPSGDVAVELETLLREDPSKEPRPQRPATGPVPALGLARPADPPAVPEPGGPPALAEVLALRRLLLALPAEAVGWPVLDDLVARLDHLIARHDQPLTVTLLGPAGHGRTALLNALAGRPVIPEASHALHIIRHGRRPGARLHWAHGGVDEQDLGALGTIVGTAEGEAPRQIEVLLPVDELWGVTVIDPPSRGAPPPTDVAIWVVDAEAPLAAWDLTAAWLSREARPAIAVLSRADRLDRAVLRQRLRAVHDHLGGRPLGVVAVSARQGLEALRSRDIPALKASGLAALHRLLHGAVIRRADALRAQGASQAAAAVRREALARAQAAVARIEDRAGELGALGGRLTVDRIRLRHETESELPERLARDLLAVAAARAAELDELQRAATPEVLRRRLAGLRRRLGQGLEAAVQACATELDDRLRTSLSRDFEILEAAYADAPIPQAHLRGLRTTLDAYRALLLEQTFARYAAFLQGWIAHAPLERWVQGQAQDEGGARLAQAGLRLGELPPLDVQDFAATLFGGLTAFVQQAAETLEGARRALDQQLVGPLERDLR